MENNVATSLPVDQFFRRFLSVIRNGQEWPVIIQICQGPDTFEPGVDPLEWERLDHEDIAIVFWNYRVSNSRSVLLETPLQQLHAIYKYGRYRHQVTFETQDYRRWIITSTEDLRALEMQIRDHRWWRLWIRRTGVRIPARLRSKKRKRGAWYHN